MKNLFLGWVSDIPRSENGKLNHIKRSFIRSCNENLHTENIVKSAIGNQILKNIVIVIITNIEMNCIRMLLNMWLSWINYMRYLFLILWLSLFYVCYLETSYNWFILSKIMLRCVLVYVKVVSTQFEFSFKMWHWYFCLMRLIQKFSVNQFEDTKGKHV